MSKTPANDLIIVNAKVATLDRENPQAQAVAIRDGKFAKVAKGIPPAQARKVVDGKDRLAFPGVVDPHMHCDLFATLIEDAEQLGFPTHPHLSAHVFGRHRVIGPL